MVPSGSSAYRLLSRMYHLKSYWKPAYAQINEMLEKYLQRKNHIQFLQIGANDGVSNDRLNQWIQSGKWEGVLVEPVPYIFDKLKGNYAENSQLKFENSAVAHEDGEMTFYSIHPKMSDRIPNYERMGTLKKEVLTEIAKKFDEPDMIEEQTVNCTSFSSLLKKYDISFLNLLLIDTEGFDHEILKMIPFGEMLPEVIIFEHVNMDDNDYRSSLNLLKKQGYKLYRLGLDTMAMQANLNIRKINL